MIKCLLCGYEFDGSECLGKDEFGRQEVRCPNCGSNDDWEEMHQCICGEYITEDKDLCENCRDMIHDAIDEAVQYMVKRVPSLCWKECIELISKYIEEE